jgi:hypothetical protein
MCRQWVTDSCYLGYWQRHADPNGWQRSMVTTALTVLHPNAQEAIALAEQDPNWYRATGHPQRGLFHLYRPEYLRWDAHGNVLPASVELDVTWQNNKRLESQALLLYWLCQTVRHSAWNPIEHQPWGWPMSFFSASNGWAHIVSAIDGLTRYLVAVTTHPHTGLPCFVTPSSSSWEEAPFSSGMTSDAAFITLALEAVLLLNQCNPPTNTKPFGQLVANISNQRLQSM